MTSKQICMNYTPVGEFLSRTVVVKLPWKKSHQKKCRQGHHRHKGEVMLQRLTVCFTPDERDVLQQMCDTDYRPPKVEMLWLLRNEAKRRGLWPDEPATECRPEAEEQPA